jgi:hypothetical protein
MIVHSITYGQLIKELKKLAKANPQSDVLDQPVTLSEFGEYHNIGGVELESDGHVTMTKAKTEA